MNYDLSFFSVEKFCYKSLLLGMQIDELLDGLKTYRRLFVDLLPEDKFGHFAEIVAEIDLVLSAY